VNAITITGLWFSYGASALFADFSLAIGPAEFFGIVGPNGAGKSTLLRLMAGLLRPSRGRVQVLGKELGRISRRAVAQTIAVVLQESHFTYDYSVQEVVLMGRNPYLGRLARPKAQDLWKVNEALRFTDVAALRDKGINEISAGERQRVILAQALAQEPKVLLLDEPTAHLDITHQQSIMAMLARLNRQGVTVVFLTHDLNLAALACSRILLLDRARTVRCGPPEQVVVPELIRSVYGVEPIILPHPQTGRPQVLMPRPEPDR